MSQSSQQCFPKERWDQNYQYAVLIVHGLLRVYAGPLTSRKCIQAELLLTVKVKILYAIQGRGASSSYVTREASSDLSFAVLCP